MKIALYKRNDYTFVNEARDWLEQDSDHIRLTEIVDITLPMLAPEVLVPKQLAALDAAEAELTAKHIEALASIQTKRKDLLALAPPKSVEAA